MAEFIIGSPLRRVARRHPRLRRWLYRLDYAAIWTLVRLFALLPADVASRLGRRTGALVGPRLKRKHGIYRDNLATAFPELDDAALEQLLRRAWGQAGRVLAEYPHLGTILREPERLDIVIREPVPTFSDPSLPCVVVSSHQSNWEVVCSAMARLGMPNASLYSPPSNPYLDRMLLDSRRALNCELLPRDNSARELLRALRQGRTVGMVMDRRVDEGKPVPFFGRDKPSTLMPARLALKFGCDLVPARVERLRDARFRVTFHPPVRPTEPGADETSQALDMTCQLHRLFEDWARASPADWFCSKRLWPKSKPAKMTPPREDGDDTDVDSYAA